MCYISNLKLYLCIVFGFLLVLDTTSSSLELLLTLLRDHSWCAQELGIKFRSVACKTRAFHLTPIARTISISPAPEFSLDDANCGS